MPVKIEWQLEVNPDELGSIVKSLEGVDTNVFNNSEFASSMWDKVFKQISLYIQKRFEEGKSTWAPLTEKYYKWKVSAARRGVQVTAGSFGKRICQLTEIGRLTDTMYPSAIEKRFANIFEVKESATLNGGSFRYAIDGNKMPYARYFNNKRPFFWITSDEAKEIFQTIENTIMTKVEETW